MIGTQNFNVRFLLVYGSATGQAQAIAEEIAEKSLSFGLKADLHSLEETGTGFNLESETCVVIITSTTGDGNPPANAEKFVRRIKKKTLSHDYLQSLNYAILGLGDTNYSNFCRCAKDIDARLEELGAKRFYSTGHADDGVGLEVVAEPWLEGLYPALQKFLGINQTMEASLTEVVHSLTLSENEESKLSPNINVNLKTTSKVDSGTSSSFDNVSSDSDRVLPQNICSSLSITDSAVKEDGDDHHCVSEINISSEPFDVPSLQINGENKQFFNGVGHWPKNSLLNNTKQQNCEWKDTPCVPVSCTKHSEDLPPLLTKPQTSLSEKDLTIPLLPPPYLGLTFCNDSIETSSLNYQNGCKLPCAASEVFNVTLSSAKVLTTQDSVKKTLLLQLNTESSSFEFSPGDSISVLCANNTSEVCLLLERLNALNCADQTVTLAVLPDTQKRRAAVPAHIHITSTLRHIFTTCLNIRETPSKALVRSLIEYTTNPCQIRRMQELCSKEGAAEYTDHIRGNQLSILDFLYAFPSCQPPVERLIEHLPRLQPRPYSICSCPQSLDIVFNVVEIPADVNKGHYYHRRGICTGWLDDITSELQCGNIADQIKARLLSLPIFLRTNQHFRPPENLSHPIIMIGPGTGVAPFIGFLAQRSAQRKLLSSGSAYGTTMLFFGCRNKDKDFIFRDELEQFEREGTLTKLCVTFSRDPPLTTSEPTVRYVQDKMRLMSTELCHLLVDQEALVYVCGDARNMAKDVNEAFMDILLREKDMSKDDAHLFMMKKRIHKTYFEDVWV
ncbi:unnamed protein product [Lymnaea stagnalis]|uniref:Methionine synthase reductase n=1 Tax=Lymnaea stagnalis TaxID=6523 RepID=A0AAV2HFL4_LYMST